MRRFEQRAAETLVLGRAAGPHGDAARDGEHGRRRRRRDGAEPHPRLGGHARSPSSRRGRSGLRRRGETLSRGLGRRSRLRLAEDGQGAANLLADVRASCGPPTWRTCCTSCRPSGAARWPPRSTTSGSPTCSRSCPRTTRSRSSASWTSERAADVLEEMEPDDAADLLAELPPETARAAARADGARRGRRRAPAAHLRRRHRRRHDDHRAGDPAAGRDGRRGARRGSATPT